MKKKNKKIAEEEIIIETPENEILPLMQIPIEKLVPMQDNVNEMTDEEFSALVNSIREDGVKRNPLLVSPLGDGTFEVVSGNHRLKASELLDYKVLPCLVEDLSKDDLVKQAIGSKMNMIHGSQNPAKFTLLHNKLAERYGDDLARQMMGACREKEFKKIYLDIKKTLPKAMKSDFEAQARDAQTVDELQKILTEMLDKYGNTVDDNFMIFTYGGKTHLWLKMDENLKVKVNKIVEKASAFEINLCEYFNKLLKYRNSIFKKYYNIYTEDIEEVFVDEDTKDDEKPVYKKKKAEVDY